MSENQLDLYMDQLENISFYIKSFLNVEENIKIERINLLREIIHEESPFKNEPVDFVKWVKNKNVVANDYNPNKVAPTEMKLLELSIVNDGYTQPIVSWSNPEKNATEVIDGFHRQVNQNLPIVASVISFVGNAELNGSR